jgi:hypothetical protein
MTTFLSSDIANPNAYRGTDSERIEQALAAALQRGLPLRLTAREPDELSERRHWLLDRAILLQAKSTLIIDNCTLQLSDASRDNFIRSANCGLGVRDIAPLADIHIIGLGRAELLGAERPRATGDGAKTLGVRSYGSDAGKATECQQGDWRNVGVLMARVSDFSISGLTLRDYHGWGISLEYCCRGRLSALAFAAVGWKMIDGVKQPFLNQDGIDLRRGCHDILIDGVSGYSGDDLVALTGIPSRQSLAGELGSSMISGAGFAELSDDIRHVVIRNVLGHCAGGHQIVRFLNTGGVKLHHITLDGLTDSSPPGLRCHATLRIGDSNPAWGGVTPQGDSYGIIIRNVHASGKHAVMIAGSLCDAVISGVVNHNPEVEAVSFSSGREYVRNVQISDCVSAGGACSEKEE